MKRHALAAALLLTGACIAQNASLDFHFVREGLPVPEFAFHVERDGSGSFHALVAPPPPRSKYSTEPAGKVMAYDQTLTLSPAAVRRFFAQADEAKFFRMPCESTVKNIAFTGTKTFTYTGPDGASSCSFNYTTEKPVAALLESFTAMAVTLEEGRRLEQKHRFDRLGLDAELGTLIEAREAGRAEEIGLIAPVLQSLVDDTALMDRVHRRAQALLATVSAP